MTQGLKRIDVVLRLRHLSAILNTMDSKGPNKIILYFFLKNHCVTTGVQKTVPHSSFSYTKIGIGVELIPFILLDWLSPIRSEMYKMRMTRVSSQQTMGNSMYTIKNQLTTYMPIDFLHVPVIFNFFKVPAPVHKNL